MKQTSLATETKPEGRIYSLFSYIKRLVLEDPLMGIIAILIILPVGGSIATSAIMGNAEILPLLIGVLTAVVLFVLVPLIITKTWKLNQREIARQKGIAIASEVERRIIREEHKQIRIDDLMDAKIKSLDAQTTYILDRSASHEKQLLVASIQEVKELFQKNEELAKVQVEYDGVLESLERIEGQLGKRAEPPAEITVADSIEVDETDYKSLFAQKRAELENMREKNENLSDEIIGQKDNLFDIKAEAERLQIELTQIATENANLKQLIHLKDNQPETLAELPENEQLIIQSEKLVSKIADFQQPEPTRKELKQALEAVDGLSDEVQEVESGWGPDDKEDDIPPNCWKCPNCGRFNNLKQNRCPKCGSSKQLLQTTNA